MQTPLYKCIIIDDEPVAHYVLISYIEKNANLTLVAQFYNAVDAMNYLNTNQVDLVFLDIDMPEISGIEMLKSLTKIPKTILTTAHSDYALESYDYGVIDYLLKPISFSRFTKAIERFVSLYQGVPYKEESNSITIKIDKKTIVLNQNDIFYIQSYGNYVKVYTKDKTYLASSTTQEIVAHLSAKKFLRIQKSYVVNLNKIEGFTDSEVLILNQKIPIGITFRSELFKRLSDLSL